MYLTQQQRVLLETTLLNLCILERSGKDRDKIMDFSSLTDIDLERTINVFIENI